MIEKNKKSVEAIQKSSVPALKRPFRSAERCSANGRAQKARYMSKVQGQHQKQTLLRAPVYGWLERDDQVFSKIGSRNDWR